MHKQLKYMFLIIWPKIWKIEWDIGKYIIIEDILMEILVADRIICSKTFSDSIQELCY